MPCSRSSRRAAVRAASSLLGPFLVSPGEPKHPIRGQAEVTEHRPERLARIDRVEELLPHLDGQSLLRSGSSPGSLGVALRSPALRTAATV